MCCGSCDHHLNCFCYIHHTPQTTTADMRVQRLVQSGVVVLKVDNRGSSRRGQAFENSIRWNMGTVEVEDQCMAVKHFVAEGLIDATRVGIYGWSYGVSR